MSDYHMVPYSKNNSSLYVLLKGLISRRLCQKSLTDIFVCHKKLFSKVSFHRLFSPLDNIDLVLNIYFKLLFWLLNIIKDN